MGAGSYATAVALTALFVVGVAVASHRIRRWLVPQWTGALGTLATAVVFVTVATLIGELLGSAGVLSRWPLVAAGVGAGVASLLLRPPPPRAVVPDPGWAGQPAAVAYRAVAIISIGAVAAQALVGLWQALHTGVLRFDSLEYHLFFAGKFAQLHNTTHLVLDNPTPFTSYYPLNDELLHGIGMALFSRDVLSLLLGFADIAAVYLAVWVLLRRSGEAAACVGLLGASCLLLCYGPTFAPGGLNDWHATWLLLAAIGFATAGRDPDGRLSGRAMLFVGLAAGQAVGTKLDVVVAATACVLLAAWRARHRVSALLITVAAAVVAGGYWYGRDLIVVGNPLPEVDLSLFGHHLPRPPEPGLAAVSASVAHYLDKPSIVRHYYVPGLHRFFGPLWPLLLVLAVAGLLLAVVRPRLPGMRFAGAVGIVAGLAYLVTPTGAAGVEGAPVLFYNNLRYALPAVLIGLALLVPAQPGRRWWLPTVTTAYAVLGASIGLRSTAWADGRTAEGVGLAGVLAVAALAVAVVLRPRGRLAVGVAGCLALVAAGLPATRHYLEDRYRGTGGLQQLFGAVAGVHDSRIGVVGEAFGYPLLGPTFSNSVSYVGAPAPHHGIVEITDCPRWRKALSSRGYRYLLVVRFAKQPAPPQYRWTVTDPGARPLVENPTGAVFRLDPSRDAAPCPRSEQAAGQAKTQ